MSWPGATRDHETFCISCHTVLPYVLSRPSLDRALGDLGPPPDERRILDNVVKRVRLWKEVEPFYGEQVGAHKTIQSQGTESVLNALILASVDAASGNLGPDTRAAFRNMWALQQTTGDQRGAWQWLDFENEPFEAEDSAFYGACLAAVAVGTGPEKYLEASEIQPNLKLLRDYIDREYFRQALSNKTIALWASEKLPGLLSSKQQAALVEQLLNKQLSDGGWSLSSLAWTLSGQSLRAIAKLWIRSEDSPLVAKSDGYATGLIAYVLKRQGIPDDNSHLQRALDWLRRNQNKTDGRWPGYSMNHAHEASATGLFMSDAATAYAVLALAGSDSRR